MTTLIFFLNKVLPLGGGGGGVGALGSSGAAASAASAASADVRQAFAMLLSVAEQSDAAAST